jgi:uncharacterized 2Fe-2S/4Fe-4S cluster protein (DUF4445 family)
MRKQTTSQTNAPETFEVVFEPYGKRVVAPRDSNILEAAQAAGLDLRSTCGGKGECGKCRVIIEKGAIKPSEFHDERFLTSEERLQGYHIACQTEILGDLLVDVPLESRLENQRILSDAVIPKIELYPRIIKVFLDPETLGEQTKQPLNIVEAFKRRITDAVQVIDSTDRSMADLPDLHGGLTVTAIREDDVMRIVQVEPGDAPEGIYGVAADIGTTKIVTYLVKLSNGSIVDVASDYNAQLPYGEDLISRIDYAVSKNDGLNVLRKAVVNTINGLVKLLADRNQIDSSSILDFCFAGNTVMTYLLAGLDPKPLNYSRTVVSRTPISVQAEEFDLMAGGNARVYCMPSVSRWLGGDTVANVLAAGLLESEKISILVDMGTNGEIVVGSRGWLFSTSCASGPAFEGYEIRFGMRSVEGAIEKVKIDPTSLKAECSLIGGPEKNPRGICGSGIIDLTAEMFTTGILSPQGKIQEIDCPLVRSGPDGMEYVVVPAQETDLQKDITLTQKDIDKFLDSKAATCAAISVLMRKVGLTISDVEVLYLSGAFGHYIDTEKAVVIGVFPEFPRASIVRLGNGSIAGAYLGLLSLRQRAKAVEIAKTMTYWDLVDDPLFTDEYYEALRLPGKLELFPTVTKKKYPRKL